MRKASSDIVFYGNCQAIGLYQLYKRYIRHEIGLKPVFIDVNPGTEQDRETIRRAPVVVFQIFDNAGWLTESDINPDAKIVRVPLYNAGFIWPYGSQAHVRNEGLPYFSHGPYPPNIGDSYLNRMIQRGVPFDRAISEYMALDIAKAAHLDRLYEISIDRQRQRDKQTDIAISDFIERRFREEELFFTPDHPSLSMFAFVARQAFGCLGVRDTLVQDAIASMHRSPFPHTRAPIHPGVASNFGLKWVNQATLFEFWDEDAYTFREFAFNYLDYRWNHDLIRGVFDPNLTLQQRLDLIDRALVASPRSFAGLLTRSECLLQVGELGKAEQCVRRAIAAGPYEFRGFHVLAKVLAAMGQWDAAVGAAERAVGVFPREASSCAVLAEVLAQAGRASDAKEWAKLAAYLAPGDADLLKQLASVLRNVEAIDDAARLAARAEVLEPGLFVEIFNELGIPLGRTTDGGQTAGDSSQEKTQAVSLYNRLGHSLLQAGDAIGAENVFRCATAIEPEMEELYGTLGEALRRQGRVGEALEYLRRLEAAGTANPHILGHLADTCRDCGDLVGAERALRRAAELDPGWRGALVQVLRAQGKDEEASRLLEERISNAA